MMRRSHSVALANGLMKGRLLFAALASCVVLLAVMAQPVFAAETSPTQASAKPTHVHAAKKHKDKAHHTSKKQANASARRPDTAGPLS